ncbi:hypothetical protein [Alicyclobacillus sp. SO9]|uniref:hypothetical protein n=1 Tax=Alicyclobacillus sp. SO9 TaxID=2665646 RepID=UPI0018E7F563|nr:hypothetical protein [Alicyclobacillus sp. SO9]QQE77490.1 hypothetical protein GI364_16280 [Alicyclobacillus sp. SO9]
MRVASIIVGLIGVGFAAVTAWIQHTGFHGTKIYGSALGTLGTAVLALIGVLLISLSLRIGVWIVFLAAVVGAVFALILWELSGSFLFVSGILGLIATRRISDEKQSTATTKP